MKNIRIWNPEYIRGIGEKIAPWLKKVDEKHPKLKKILKWVGIGAAVIGCCALLYLGYKATIAKGIAIGALAVETTVLNNVDKYSKEIGSTIGAYNKYMGLDKTVEASDCLDKAFDILTNNNICA